LSNAATIASDKLKAVVTGDPVTAKSIFREPVEFKPTAVHVFSTPVFPSFKGGVDAGIER
jgi:phage/plasmid-associated DNA primase